MASPAFRSLTTVADATAANCTGSEPAGAAQNDILRADLYIESDTAVTAPAGWSNTFKGSAALQECDTASHAFRHYAYWIRRGSSAPSFAWTHSSAYRGLVIVAYSGAVTTEDPWSFIAQAKRDDTTASTHPAVSGTTLTADELLTWVGAFFTTSVDSGTPPTGFTERLDSASSSQREVADLAQAAAGSTGSVTGALWTVSPANNQPATSIMAGLKSVAESGGATAVTRPSSLALLGVGI